MNYCISLLVNEDNAIDTAHYPDRCPLPFLSSMVDDDCMKRGKGKKTVQEGGAVYILQASGLWNLNVADSPQCG